MQNKVEYKNPPSRKGIKLTKEHKNKISKWQRQNNIASAIYASIVFLVASISIKADFSGVAIGLIWGIILTIILTYKGDEKMWNTRRKNV